MMLEKYDKAQDWLEKGYELHDPQMPFISTSIYRSTPINENSV
jgi:hypothetical protein